MNRYLRIFTTLFALSATTISLAKSINLYDQPKTDSKIVGSIDASSSMVPIFTTPTGDWIKIGDPKNGNVGWVKVSELGTNAGPFATGLSITQHTITTKEGPKTYQTIQFGVPQVMTSEQAQAFAKKMQERQVEIQQYTQKMMKDFFNDMNSMFQTNQANFPVFVPMIVLPQPQKPQATPTNNTKPLENATQKSAS
jgi:hypothetical protein